MLKNLPNFWDKSWCRDGEQKYILSNSLIIFKKEFVGKMDLPYSVGTVMLHRAGWFGNRNLSIIFFQLFLHIAFALDDGKDRVTLANCEPQTQGLPNKHSLNCSECHKYH